MCHRFLPRQTRDQIHGADRGKSCVQQLTRSLKTVAPEFWRKKISGILPMRVSAKYKQRAKGKGKHKNGPITNKESNNP